MQLAVTGVNHETAPVWLRERLAFRPAALSDAYSQLLECKGIEEALILSTCNRVEVYAVLDPLVSPRAVLEGFLGDFHELDAAWFEQHFYMHEGIDVVSHLFEVASSIDSMVVGETQILAQVKEAYWAAIERNSVGGVLHSLFQDALRVAKRIRSESGISVGKVSVSSVAVDFAEKVMGDLAGAKVLVIGAGETSELTLLHLIERGGRTALVANRTFDRAKELAEKHDAEAITLDKLSERLAEADIIISSTRAPGYVIKVDDVRNALARRHGRQAIFIDIAVPRDIDPAIDRIDNAYLYNIDELESVVRENSASREADVEVCRELIRSEAEQFMRAISSRVAGPVLQELERTAGELQQQEFERLAGKLPHLSEKDRDEIQYAMRRLANKILHNPKTTIADSAREGHGPRVVEVVRRLFGLSE